LVLRMQWLHRLMSGLAFRLRAGRAAEVRANPQMASRLYSELLRILERRGFRRREGETPREFAASLLMQPALGPVVTEFTDLYAEARFGGAPCDTFRLRGLLEQVRSVPRPR